MGEPGRRGPARRAAELTRLLAPWRWHVAAWAGGYALTGPCGALPPATCVDEVVARAEAARPGTLAAALGPEAARPCTLGEAAGPGEELDLAGAVVRASVLAATTGGPVLLAGPVRGPSTVIAHGAVEIAVVPRAGVGWSVVVAQDAGVSSTSRATAPASTMSSISPSC